MWEGKPWWVDAGASEHELEDVRQQITELLNPPTSAAVDEDGETADGVGATVAVIKASGAATATQQSSAASAGQQQDGGEPDAAPFSPVIAAATPDVLQDPAIHPQPSLDSAELAAAVNPQMSPDENRSDASDTTGAGQRSPNARPGFSPVVVEGRPSSSSLAGSKRRSPAAADTHDAQPAKRADTGPKAEQPAADAGSMAAAAWAAAAGPGLERTPVAHGTGVSQQAAPGANDAASAQQSASADEPATAGAGNSPSNRPPVPPAQPGLATAVKRLSVSPLHPEMAATTAPAVNGNAAADISRVTGSTDVIAATAIAAADAGADDTIMSQDSAEPGEIIM